MLFLLLHLFPDKAIRGPGLRDVLIFKGSLLKFAEHFDVGAGIIRFEKLNFH